MFPFSPKPYNVVESIIKKLHSEFSVEISQILQKNNLKKNPVRMRGWMCITLETTLINPFLLNFAYWQLN